MSIVRGSIVRAKAGREKDNFFVVLRVESGYAYIADGRTRKLEKPKKKKPKGDAKEFEAALEKARKNGGE